MTNLYTLADEQFIIKNYPVYGPKYCASHLDRDADSLNAKARRMGLRKIGTYKHPSMQKINPEQFWNIIQPEIAYILGYLWADGYIHHGVTSNKSKSNKITYFHKINLEIVSEDYISISNVFDSIGEWAIQTRKRKESWKETTTLSTNSKDIYSFLLEHGYNDKSNVEPTDILAKIPDNLKPYWWRGLFDGDGSISFGTGIHRYKSLQFSSTYGYKWQELMKLYTCLDISNINISDQITKEDYKSSKITIQNIAGIKSMIKFLLCPCIGLERKTLKMLNFLEKYPD